MMKQVKAHYQGYGFPYFQGEIWSQHIVQEMEPSDQLGRIETQIPDLDWVASRGAGQLFAEEPVCARDFALCNQASVLGPPHMPLFPGENRAQHKVKQKCKTLYDLWVG